MFCYIAVACALGVAAAAPSGYGLEHAPVGLGVAVDSVSVPRYNFNYAVNDPATGDNKAQHETREGGIVKGSYSLTEPDGTLRVVDYTADPHSGFNAVVKRLGPAAHPQQVTWHKPAVAVAPIAAAPIDHGWSQGLELSHGHGWSNGHELSHGQGWSNGLELSHGGWSNGVGLSHGHGWSNGLDGWSQGLGWSHDLGFGLGYGGYGYGADLGSWKH